MKKFVALLFLLALLLVSCGGSEAPDAQMRTGAAEGAAEEAAEGAPAPAAAPAADSDSSSAGMRAGGISLSEESEQAPNEQVAAINRRIIYRATLKLRVEEPRVTAQQLQSLAASYGGYVSKANLYEIREGIYQGSVELRVAADRFDAALNELRGQASEVLSELIESQDVTEQYVDLEARVENLERTERELQALLSEAREKGGTEDVLRVYQELTAIREQIERYEGQLNVLRDAVSLATITVELVPPEMQVELLDEEWSATRTVRQALRTLTGGLQGLADVALYFLIAVFPILLLLGGGIFAAVRLLIWLYRRTRPALKSEGTD